MFTTKKRIIKILICYLLILSMVNQVHAAEYTNGQSGSIGYQQQELMNSGTGSSSVGMNGDVNYNYPMGDVSLSYSSRYGWRINGYSSITRSTRKGATWYWKDGSAFKSVYELNGEELVLISSPSADPLEYRTKIESFKKILFHNPPTYEAVNYGRIITDETSYWEVNNPDGSIEYYGNTTDSKIKTVNGNPKTTSGAEPIREWAINKIESRGGYEVSNFKYILGSAGNYYLSMIISNKKGCGALGYMTTKLLYGDETDPAKMPISYRTSSKIQIDKYLSSVKVYTSESDGSEVNPMNLYKIDYTEGSTGQRLVSQITKYGKAGVDGPSLPPTKFFYNTLNKSFASTSVTWTCEDKSYLRQIHKDGAITANLIDMNGDGLPDRVFKLKGSFSDNGGYDLKVGLNNGSGFDATTDWAVADINEISQTVAEKTGRVPVTVDPAENISIWDRDAGDWALLDWREPKKFKIANFKNTNSSGVALTKEFTDLRLKTMGMLVPEWFCHVFAEALITDSDKINIKLKLIDAIIPDVDATVRYGVSDLIDMDGDGKPDRINRVPLSTPGDSKLTIQKNNGAGFDATTDIPGRKNFRKLEFITGEKTTQKVNIYFYWGCRGLFTTDYYRSTYGALITESTTNNDHIYSVKDKVWQTSLYYPYAIFSAKYLELETNVTMPAMKNPATTADIIDMNGDGKVDIIYPGYKVYYGPSYSVYTDFTMSNATDKINGFESMHTWLTLVDINGDGLPDTLSKKPSDGSVLKGHLNRGYKFDSSDWDVDLNQWSATDNQYFTTVFSNSTKFDYIDMNGDGLPDRVNKEANGALSVSLNKGGNVFGTSETWANTTDAYHLRHGESVSSDFPSQKSDYIDMNGDGLPDRVVKLSYSNNLLINFNQAGAADKLCKIQTPIGGTTEYTYKALNKKESPDCKPNMWVVDQVKVNDGFMSDEPTSTNKTLKTTYEFKYGVYDTTENMFRGFEYVKTTGPTGDYVTTNYYVDDEYLVGLKNMVIEFNSDAKVFSTTIYDYDYKTLSSNNRVKYRYPTCTSSLISDGTSSNGKFTKIEYTNDLGSAGVYGVNDFISNISVINKGEVDVGGDIGCDKIESKIKYINDPANWIIGLEQMKEIWGYEGNISTYKRQGASIDYYSLDAKKNLIETRSWNGSGTVATLPVTDDPATADIDWINPIKYTYDTYGNLSTVQDPKGNITTKVYDTRYRSFPIKTTNAAGQSAYTYYDTASYTGTDIGTISNNITRGQVYMQQDINNQFHHTRYDSFGRVIKSWGPYGSDNDNYRDEQITYQDAIVNSDGKIAQPANILVEKLHAYNQYNKLWTRTSIDGLGRTIQIKTNPADNQYACKIIRTYYTMEDNIFTGKGKLSVIVTHIPFHSNQSGPDLVYEGIISPHTQETIYLDSTEGRVSLIYKPKYGYPSTSYTQIKTTSKQWCTQVTDEKGNTTKSYNDGLGRVVKAVDANGTETKYFYKSGIGALLRIEAAGNKVIPGITTPVVTSFAYNMLGQKTDVWDPDMGHMNYEYDLNGNIRYIEDPDPKTNFTLYDYDNLNRLIKQTTYNSAGSVVGELINVYDNVSPWDEGYAIGMLVKTTTKMSGSVVSERFFSYDKLQRLVKEKHNITDGASSKSATMEYTYNAAGQVTKLKYPDTEEVTYEYNMNTGLENEVRNQDWYRYVTNIKYLPYGKIKEMTYGYENGVVTSYRYNDHGEDGYPDGIWDYRLNRIEFNKSGGFNHWQKYEYDDVGNITKIQDKNASYNQTFDYDNLHRLSYASGIYYPSGYDYEYDEIGNITRKEGMLLQYYESDHVHAISYANGLGYDFDYDANGNMIEIDTPTSSEDRYYTYDHNNMLIKVEDGSSNEIMRAEYNGINRVKLIEGNKKTYYFFPQYTEITDSGSGVNTKINYYFSNGDRIAEREKDNKGSNKLFFYHKDHLGSTIRMTDANGSAKNSTYYKPYGEALVQAGSTRIPDYQYNDKENIDNGDLYYYESRYYNPTIGRFTTPDPATPGAGIDLQGLNRYSYCNNNPVKYIDPTGHGPALLDMSYANNVYLNGMNFLYGFGFFPGNFSFLDILSFSGMYSNLFNGGFTGGGTLGIGPLNLSISGTKGRQWMDYHYFERTLNISASISHDFNKAFNKSLTTSLSYDLSRTWRENDYTSNSGTYSLGVKLSRFTESSEAGLSLSGNINQLILSTSENKGSTGYPGIENWGINTAFNQGLIFGRVGLSGSGSSGVQFGLQNVHNRYTGQGYSGAGLDVKSFSLTNSIGLTARFGNGLSAGISYSNTRGWLMGLSNDLIMNTTTLGITGGFQRGEWNFNFGLKKIIPEGSYNRYEFNLGVER